MTLVTVLAGWLICDILIAAAYGRRRRWLAERYFTPDGELTEQGERYAEDLHERAWEDEAEFADMDPEPYPDGELY